MRRVLALRYLLEGVKVLLDSLVESLRVDHDVGVLRVLEGNDLELKLLPLVTDALKDCLVLGLGVGVLDDLVDVVLVVLNIVFS